MTVETLVAETVELFADGELPDEHDLAVRHDLPVAAVRTTLANAVAAATFHTMPALYWCIVDSQHENGHGELFLRPSIPPSAAAVDGAAAQVACPDDPAREGRDRPLGAAVSSPWRPRTGEGGES